MSSNSSNRINVPESKQGREHFWMRSANEVGVNLNNGGGALPEDGVYSGAHNIRNHAQKKCRPGVSCSGPAALFS